MATQLNSGFDVTPRRPTTRPIHALAIGLLALVAAAGSTLLAPSPAMAAPPRHTAAHVSTSTSKTTPGARVVISGNIVERGAAAHRKAVVVQQRTHGTSRWHTFRRTKTTTGGSVRVRSAPLVASTDYRLRYSSSGSTTTSGVATVTVPTAVSVTATSPLTPTAGDAIVLAGTTSSQLAGARIYLQLLVAETWKTVSSSQVSENATYNVQAVSTLGGDRQYRAMVKGSPGRAQATTDPVEFTVLAWYRVADLAPVPAPHAGLALTPGTRLVGGSWYEQSLGRGLDDGTSSDSAYGLDNRCTTFRATIGVAGDALTSTSARWRMLADDDVALDTTLTAGATTTVTASITGAASLELRAFALAGSGDVIWANPEVLCAGRP